MLVIGKEEVFRNSAWGTFRGSKFLVAPTSDIAFQRTFNRLQAPHRKSIERGKLDPAIAQEITVEAMAKNMLLDWKDVVDAEGKEVEYTEALGVQVLTSQLDLREFIQEFSADIENFRAVEKEEMGKT